MVILLQAQINIVLSILLIILFINFYFTMNRKKITNRLFMWIMGLTCFTLILEVLSILLSNPNLKKFIILNKLVNTIGFIVVPIIPFLVYMFSKEWINRHEGEKIKVKKILLLPIFINGIGALMSYNGGALFHITSENIYERGPLFFILPCVSYIYLVFIIYFICKHSKKFTYSELVLFSLFNIVPAIFTSIQLKYYVYLTTWNSTAIIIVVTYIFILNDQVYHDSLTGIENRLSYEHYYEKIDNKKLSRLSIVYIDIDEFKTINDQYGHSEGDEVIKAFANLLVKSFSLRQKKLIRIGGDEFLILLENQCQEKVEAYIQNLIQNVDTYNNREKKQYRIKFSYGIAYADNDHKSVQQLLEYADKSMYEQKQNKSIKL